MSHPVPRKMLADPIRPQEARKILGVTRPTILAMVARKELEGEVVGGTLFVCRTECERLAATRTTKAAA